MAEWLKKRKPATLTGSLALLAIAMALAFPPAAWVAYGRFGANGVWAAATAAGVCWGAASLALACTALFRGPQVALFALLFGMLFRMGVPLVAGLFLSRTSQSLAVGGVFGFMVFFYLVALMVETLLSLGLVEDKHSASPIA